MLAERKSLPEARSKRGGAQVFHLSFLADPLSVRAALCATRARFARQMSEDEAGTLELVLAEVLNNIVEHGYGADETGTITLSMVRDRRSMICSVSDDGVELPARCLDHLWDGGPSRPLPEDLPEGGFGWFLIRDLAEDLGYHREGGRNLLAFRLPLQALSSDETGADSDHP